MPYLDTEPSLPFQGSSPLARHTSRKGAESAAPRAGSQTERYLTALREREDGLTDHEAARLLRIPNTSVCARRSALVKEGVVYAEGVRLGPNGVQNAVWRIRR